MTFPGCALQDWQGKDLDFTLQLGNPFCLRASLQRDQLEFLGGNASASLAAEAAPGTQREAFPKGEGEELRARQESLEDSWDYPPRVVPSPVAAPGREHQGEKVIAASPGAMEGIYCSCQN